MAQFSDKAIQLKDLISEYHNKFPDANAVELSERIKEAGHHTDYSKEYFRKIINEWAKIYGVVMNKKKRENYTAPKVDVRKDTVHDTVQETQPKYDLEKDGFTINYKNQTVVTDLGEYGHYVCSIERHRNIQFSYVNDGDGETAAIVAMRFNFQSPKAVYLYAKIHGFTKASIPQTDIDIANGSITVDEAIEQNIQTLKREIHKKTQTRKWRETEQAALCWWNFESVILEEIKSLNREQKDIKINQLNLIIPKTDYNFSSIIGISDLHYMKICYDHNGRVTYNRDMAKRVIEDHTIKLAQETARYGRPDQFYIIVGNDNMHVDNLGHTTTKLTPQTEATDGLWRIEFKNYIKIQIEHIEYYKQISKVVLVPVKGNHDYQTSIALHAFLEVHYENDPQVEVLTCLHDRVYVQYGKNCYVFQHGNELGSIAKIEKDAHKLILSEAREHGINIQEVLHYYVIHGHYHAGSSNEIGGFVERICLGSPQMGADLWHQSQGFTGVSMKSQVIHFDKEFGKKGVSFV